jgi:hypothetical protein
MVAISQVDGKPGFISRAAGRKRSWIGAVGMDVEGNKHVLAIREGATENAAVAKELLEDLAAPPRRSRSRSLRPSESVGKASTPDAPGGYLAYEPRPWCAGRRGDCVHEKPPVFGMKNLHGGCGEPGFQLLAGHLVREPYPFMKLLYLFACGALAM